MTITASITKKHIPLGLYRLGHVEDINQIMKWNEFTFHLDENVFPTSEKFILHAVLAV